MNAEDRIIQKLVELAEKVTKIGGQTSELVEFKEYAMNELDKHTAILQRLEPRTYFYG